MVVDWPPTVQSRHFPPYIGEFGGKSGGKLFARRSVSEISTIKNPFFKIYSNQNGRRSKPKCAASHSKRETNLLHGRDQEGEVAATAARRAERAVILMALFISFPPIGNVVFFFIKAGQRLPCQPSNIRLYLRKRTFAGRSSISLL